MSAFTAVARSLGVLCALAVATTAPAQTVADYGDAPDNTLDASIEAYPGIPGRFPTLFDTAHAAIAGNKGAHHLAVNEEWLAEPGVAAGTTLETDAKLVDQDEDDADVRIICVAGLIPPPPGGGPVPMLPCFLLVRVVHAGGVAAGTPRVVNALVDADRDGDWRSADPLGTWPHEHVIVDKQVPVPADGERGVGSGIFFLSSTQSRWVRVTLTRSALGVAGWEGSVPPGGLALGETEDHLVTPILVKPEKEHVSNFSASAAPPVVVVPPGGAAGFTVTITRKRQPSPPSLPANGLVMTVFGCQTFGGTGISIPPPAGYAGAIVNDAGVLTSPLLNAACGPPTPCVVAVEGPFMGSYAPPYHGQRVTTCKVGLAVDPPGEVYDYDDAYRSELPVKFLEAGVPDGDGDGVPDAQDLCGGGGPLQKEDLDGFADGDGCLDPDNDGDGVADSNDQCGRDLEDVDGVADTDGCPDPSFFDVFTDVPNTHWAWRHVETLYNAGVAGGCAATPLRYCPDAVVSREQMAVFLLVSRLGPRYSPPPAQGIFQDVPASSPFARWVEDLYLRRITGGCGVNPLRYCPGAEVTRAQMAVFLLTALEGPGYTPPPPTGIFEDVPVTSPFAPWIEELSRLGITAGCSVQPALFCPTDPVSRASMASFLGRMFWAVP